MSTTQQPVQTAAEDNVNIEENPSYHTVDSCSPQRKPTTEDNANMEENSSYLTLY